MYMQHSLLKCGGLWIAGSISIDGEIKRKHSDPHWSLIQDVNNCHHMSDLCSLVLDLLLGKIEANTNK